MVVVVVVVVSRKWSVAMGGNEWQWVAMGGDGSHLEARQPHTLVEFDVLQLDRLPLALRPASRL